MTSKTKRTKLSFKYILVRARLLFGVLLLLLALSFSSSFILGWQSGEIQIRIVQPTKRFVTSTIESLFADDDSEKSASPSGSWKKYVNVTPTQRARQTNQPQKTIIQSQIQQNTGNSSEEALRRQNEWWAQVQAENARKSEESRRSVEEFGRQSRENLEKFRAESEVKRQEFIQQAQAESQARLEAWKKEHGF